MWADSAVDQQLQQIRAQHVPVVVVILLAFITANHEAADSLVGQQCLIDREVGEILFDRDPLLRVERLTRLDRIERGRWIVGSSANGSGGSPGGKWSRTLLEYAVRRFARQLTWGMSQHISGRSASKRADRMGALLPRCAPIAYRDVSDGYLAWRRE